MALANVNITDTFDVWRVRTNQLIVAFEQSATLANSASLSANVAVDIGTSAFAKANSANYLAFLVNANTTASFDRTNLAFTQANTANVVAIAAFTQANIGSTIATAAFPVANSGYIIAPIAYNRANAAYDQGTALSGAVTTANNTAIAAFTKANTAVTNGAAYIGSTIIADTISANTITATKAYMNVYSLTDAAVINVNFNLSNNFNVTLGGARTLANPTNTSIGQSGIIYISQDGTGGRVLAFGSNWKFPGNIAPTLTITANAVDAIVYSVRTANSIISQSLLNVG